MSATHIQFQPFEDDDDDRWEELTWASLSTIDDSNSCGEVRDEILAGCENNLDDDASSYSFNCPTPIVFWHRGASTSKACPTQGRDNSGEQDASTAEANDSYEESEASTVTVEAKDDEQSAQESSLVTQEELREQLVELKVKFEDNLEELRLAREALTCFRNEQERAEQTVDEIKTELVAARLHRELFLELKHKLAARELEKTRQELQGSHEEHEVAKGVLESQLEAVKSQHLGLEKKHEAALKDLERAKGDLSDFWSEHEHTASELQTAKMQKNDLEKKLEKKEEDLDRARKEVTTLKKVISLSTSMVAMQRDHAVTAVAEKDMEVKGYKEKIERLKAELLQSRQREQQALRASKSEIKVLRHKLATAGVPFEEEYSPTMEDLIVSPDKKDFSNRVTFASPFDHTKGMQALTSIKQSLSELPAPSLPSGPRTPISPTYTKSKLIMGGKENNGKNLFQANEDGKRRSPKPRIALVDALFTNQNIKSLFNEKKAG